MTVVGDAGPAVRHTYGGDSVHVLTMNTRVILPRTMMVRLS